MRDNIARFSDYGIFGAGIFGLHFDAFNFIRIGPEFLFLKVKEIKSVFRYPSLSKIRLVTH